MSPRHETRAAATRVVVIASLTSSLTNFRFDLLRGFLERGCDVHALAPDDDPEVIAALEREGVRFHRIPMARASVEPLGDLRTLWAIWRLLRRIRPVILLPYTMKPIIYGLIAGRLAGVPERYALFTGLGYAFGDDGRSARRALVRRASVRLYRLALKGVRLAFAYNDADMRDILAERMLEDPGRLRLLAGTGVNLSHFSRQPLPEGPPVFLMIARLLREKGVLDFTQAAGLVRSSHPEARFRLLGPRDPNPSGLSEAEIREACASGGVEYLGEARDVRPHLAAASVFVLPSYYREGVPRTLQEALAIGRAIITTDHPGCRETVEVGRNGFLVPPREPAALAEAMRRFVSDPGLAERMGAEAARVASARFDVRRVNDAVFQAMGLAGRPRPGWDKAAVPGSVATGPLPAGSGAA